MSKKKRFNVYITKYALTKGIICIMAEWDNLFPDMVRDVIDVWRGGYHGEGIEWHRTLDGAKEMAVKMRDKKIVSLQKQIHKLEKMNFSIIHYSK